MRDGNHYVFYRMKSSVPRLLSLIALLFGCAIGQLKAQDAVVQKDGQTREGAIQGIKAGAIRIKVGPAETSIPMSKVASVRMDPPADYQAVSDSWIKGDAVGTLSKLLPLVANFKGLPTDWAERACSMLTEVYISLGKISEAEAAYVEFNKLYPESVSSSDLLLIRLALIKNDFRGARSRLEPMVESAKSTLRPKGAASVAMSQALVLMGRIHEHAGEKSEALENYLLVSTIFNDDPSSSAQALERINTLQKDKVIVP